MISGSVLEVKRGDNITLYCDCKPSTAVYIVWFRNCSHENQPSLVLTQKRYEDPQKFHRYKLVKNSSSDSYNLFITNVSASDEGLYYCGTAKREDQLTGQETYSNDTTRVIVGEYFCLSYLCVTMFTSNVIIEPNDH